MTGTPGADVGGNASDEVALVRAFNRNHTRRIGALADSYLGGGRPLGAARLLHEIGEGSAAVELRRRLDLDSGYLSRLLRELERDGLVRVEPDPTDRRRRRVRPTAAGRREQRRLDERSNQLVTELLTPLSPRLRRELAETLERADNILAASTADLATVHPSSPAARFALTRYFAELDARFDGGFDPGSGGADDDVDALVEPAGTFVVLRAGDSVVGCGGLLCIDDTTSEVKRMWIDGRWRGLGLGGRILAHLEGVSRGRGRLRVVLDTNAVLTEAISLYERHGYRSIERYNDNPYAQRWFEKHLAAS